MKEQFENVMLIIQAFFAIVGTLTMIGIAGNFWLMYKFDGFRVIFEILFGK